MNNIQPLNERVVNLEAICSNEFDSQKNLKQIEVRDEAEKALVQCD
jgi:hypothetical protein